MEKINGIKYAFAMFPLMSIMLSTAEFLQTDITYNENSQYPYLFNAVVFNDIAIEWMAVARVRLSPQSEHDYRLACKEKYPHIDLGKKTSKLLSLIGVMQR